MTTLAAVLTTVAMQAQEVSVKWSLSDISNPNTTEKSGESTYTDMLTTSYECGTNFTVSTMTKSGADTGYEAVTYDPTFAQYTATAKVSTCQDASAVKFTLKIADGHFFKITNINLDAARVGSDKPGMTIRFNYDDAGEQKLGDEAESVALIRNKIMEGNSTGYGHYSFDVNDVVANDQVTLVIYGQPIDAGKGVALRNVTIEGVMDEKEYKLSDLLNQVVIGEDDLTDKVANLKNNGILYTTKKVTKVPVYMLIGYTDEAENKGWANFKTSIDGHYKVIQLVDANNVAHFTFKVYYPISDPQPKGTATPLNRGLMAVNLAASGGTGNLISWRAHKIDDTEKYKSWLYTTEGSLVSQMDGTKTNYVDTNGKAGDGYRLVIWDKDTQNLIANMTCKAWDSQTFTINMGAAPTDERGYGATYTPNDGSYYDMDGDGEPEFIVKWDPSNSKDASSVGVTSNTYIDCYKMDGTRLWRIDLGQNIRSGAHTTPFLCYDFDQDGFGELVVKTAPGTVDGEGNFVLMDEDAATGPAYIWYNTDNVPEKAQGHVLGDTPEYLTVFDGATGRELKTVKHPLPYNIVANWGDDYGGRSDRYLAAPAYIDGEHPYIIWARGYYYSASLAAVKWDGTDLTTEWIHKAETAGQDIYNEGAHSMVTADIDGDGKDEIVYGAAAVDHDGTFMYRTGRTHGDAMHVGDFDLDNPGLEVFMVHEEGIHGYELRDAKTGTFILNTNASSDTGRGVIADFSKETAGSEYAVFNTDPLRSTKPAATQPTEGYTIGEAVESTSGTWLIGSSGCAPNNIVYWDGSLQSTWNVKNVLAHWNDETHGWDRYKVNGTYYTDGSTINGTKNNPVVSGDILGDWREEIVLYQDNGDGTFSLVINATDIPTDYKVPYLRDDRQYDEAICWQNSGYNQPPHLSFDLYTTYKDYDPLNPTAVEAITSTSTTTSTVSAPRKALIDGRLVIVNGGKQYNVAGAEVK